MNGASPAACKLPWPNDGNADGARVGHCRWRGPQPALPATTCQPGEVKLGHPLLRLVEGPRVIAQRGGNM
eukprot:5301461-Lingulodinium_polyedra.AAC.1